MNFFSALIQSSLDILVPKVLTDEEENGGRKTGIDSLPRDVLIEIFLRLPVESLVQVKDVSRHMRRLVQSEHFTRLHLEQSRSKNNGFICYTLPHPNNNFISSYLFKEKYQPSFLSLDFTEKVAKTDTRDLGLEYCLRDFMNKYSMWMYGVNVRVIDSCDGLLLLEICGDCDLVQKTPLLICNPVTRSYKLLHSPDYGLDMKFCYWKIVYDPSVRKYIVVGLDLSWNKEGTCYILELQNRKGQENTWKTLKMPLSPDIRYAGATVFKDRKLYCLMTQYDERRKNKELGMLCVDIETQEVTYNCPILRPFSVSSYLFSSGNKIYRTFRQRDRIELWVLEDFESFVWSKHHVAETKNCDVLDSDFPMGYVMSPMTVLNLGGDDQLVMKHWDEICTYHKSSKEWEWFELDFKEFEAFRHQTIANVEYYVPHVNSLISWNISDDDGEAH